MKSLFYFITCFLLLSGCESRQTEMPVWANSVDTITLPAPQLIFKTANKDWNATLLTFVQPVKLATSFINGRLFVDVANTGGVLEGPAQICLSSGRSQYYYPVYILNKPSKTVTREYRSSKTVNPDSSLTQQRIIHSIDANQNLISLNKNEYFFERIISITPIAGTYHIVKKQGLSAYYVQPGSCKTILVKGVYRKENRSFYVTAGPLKDRYVNIVANGTLVRFTYKDLSGIHQAESLLLNGYASISIPAQKGDQYIVKASVNETVSNSINLKF
jgi:hypothetical protein